MSECRSFPYVISDNSEILILGSMPGIKSLEMQQYYAHPQNRFWKVMGHLCKNKSLHTLDYETRLKTLTNNGFALWDVLKYCKRDGSLDTSIKNEKPNDIDKLLKQYPKIKRIVFNGNKAFMSFKKYFPMIYSTYECFILPSTSPANARFTIMQLLEQWEKICIA